MYNPQPRVYDAERFRKYLKYGFDRRNWHNKDSLDIYFERTLPGPFPHDTEYQGVQVRHELIIDADPLTTVLDWHKFNFFNVTVGDSTTFSFVNPRPNSDFTILLTKDETPTPYSITWPAALSWENTPPVTDLTLPGQTVLIFVSYYGGVYRAMLGSSGTLDAINVKSAPFNAKGDAKEISITTAAGSNTFTASSAVFNTASVGKTIITQYGGVSNGQITAVITGYVSPTVVTTSVAATLNSSGPATFGTNDTEAFQKAIDSATTEGKQITATGGMYLVNKVTAEGLLSVASAGMGLASIVFISAADNLEYRGSGSPWAVKYPNVHLKDVSILGSYEANTTLGVVDIEFSYGQSPNRYVVMDNVKVGTLGFGWDRAVRLWNASNYSTNQVNIVGYGPIRSGSIGLSVGGDEKPIDMYNFGLRAYFCDYGVKVEGQPLFSDVMEGISFIGCALLFNNYSLWCDTGAPFPYVQVNGCNLNSYKKDIFLRNIHQAHIIDNLFYSCDRSPTEPNWNGIEISNSATGPASDSANIISGNIISGANTPSTSTACITVNASGGSDTATLISGNLMTGADYGILLFSGSKNVKVFNDNEYQSVTNKITNSGTNNTVAQTTFGAEWSTTSNDGLITKGGVQTVILGAGGRAVVTFPVAFPTACYNVIAQKAVSDANSNKPMHPDSFITSSFNIYVPTGAPGESWAVSYIAVGK